MNRYISLLFAGILLAACGQDKPKSGSYVLSVTVEAYDGNKNKGAVVERFETDTVAASSALAAYSKGIQKYAAVLMHIQQFPDSIQGTGRLAIYDSNGQDIVSTIPQTQRDSVIMNFIQFARRATIPYYDRVKDFELKLMTAR